MDAYKLGLLEANLTRIRQQERGLDELACRLENAADQHLLIAKLEKIRSARLRALNLIRGEQQKLGVTR